MNTKNDTGAKEAGALESEHPHLKLREMAAYVDELPAQDSSVVMKRGEPSGGLTLTESEMIATKQRIAQDRRREQMKESLFGVDSFEDQMHAAETEHKAVAYVRDVVDMNDRLRRQNNHLIAENAKLRSIIKALTESATASAIPDMPSDAAALARRKD